MTGSIDVQAMGVAIDEETHRAQMCGVFGQGSIDGRLQRAGTMAVQKSDEAAGALIQPSSGQQRQPVFGIPF